MKTLNTLIVMLLFINSFGQPEDLNNNTFIKSDQDFEPARTNTVGLADLDSDGDLDAVFANMGFNDSRILLNDGNGNFTYTKQKLTQQGHGTGIGDIDADGDLDLIIPCAGFGSKDNYRQLSTKIYLNNGEGYFTDSGQSLGDSLESGNGVNLIDIDSDNDLDAHIYYYSTETNSHYHRIYLNDGKGKFTLSKISFKEGYNITWGDLDNDSDVDALVRYYGKGILLFTNNGNAEFTESWIIKDTSIYRGGTGLCDFDDDKDIDIIVTRGTRKNPESTVVLINQGDGIFKKMNKELPVLSAAAKFLFADLNNDGNMDTYIRGFFRPNLIWMGDGKGNFIETEIKLCDKEPTGTCGLGDLDKDGDIDIFNAFFGNGSNSVYFNQTIK